jgi:hypothetical protein
VLSRVSASGLSDECHYVGSDVETEGVERNLLCQARQGVQDAVNPRTVVVGDEGVLQQALDPGSGPTGPDAMTGRPVEEEQLRERHPARRAPCGIGMPGRAVDLESASRAASVDLPAPEGPTNA